ncbi:hypothetical protein D6T64_16055 [Cryobacterium melibiosiphilum]|uniref:Lipoprotein n=1 Tax=Cryobacterium melibiosiphilum TaxID=995039 RepID=A0A3A5MP20_9MICO|nr:hypothetical protein [Cryobacterium melibiosiphilum]RJT87254.1 hypothetical protein D6T64_16055 [Cryobacterium melibiosiphilum]
MILHKSVLSLAALVVVLPLLAGCSASGAEPQGIGASAGDVEATAEADTTETTEAEAEAEAEAAMPDPNCLTVSAATIARIQAGVQGIDPANTLTRATAYKAGDRSDVYFIAGEITGAGMEVGDANGLWATNGDPVTDEKSGLTFSVDGFAKSFSDWADGDVQDLSASEAGAEEAIACLEALQE